MRKLSQEDLFKLEDNDVKTSAVHFLRFELTAQMVRDAKQGAAIAMGVDHPAYTVANDPIAPNVRDVLVADLQDNH